MRGILCVALLAIAAGTAWGGTASVPHVFQAGTPAKAAEVNANFIEVENAVNDNASHLANHEDRISANEAAIQSNSEAIAAISPGTNPSGIQVYDGGGQYVGVLLSMPSPDDLGAYARVYIPALGKFIDIDVTDGRPRTNGRLYYPPYSNCLGDAYMYLDGFTHLASFYLYSFVDAESLFHHYEVSVPFECAQSLGFSYFIGNASGCRTPTDNLYTICKVTEVALPITFPLQLPWTLE